MLSKAKRELYQKEFFDSYGQNTQVASRLSEICAVLFILFGHHPFLVICGASTLICAVSQYVSSAEISRAIGIRLYIKKSVPEDCYARTRNIIPRIFFLAKVCINIIGLSALLFFVVN